MGVRADLLQPLTMPGTIVGDLLPEVVEETGLSGVKVIAVGEHDTASAFCGCPLEDENAAALSCGTWSLLGMEVDEPVLTKDAFEYNYTNETKPLSWAQGLAQQPASRGTLDREYVESSYHAS